MLIYIIYNFYSLFIFIKNVYIYIYVARKRYCSTHTKYYVTLQTVSEAELHNQIH